MPNPESNSTRRVPRHNCSRLCQIGSVRISPESNQTRQPCLHGDRETSVTLQTLQRGRHQCVRQEKSETTALHCFPDTGHQGTRCEVRVECEITRNRHDAGAENSRKSVRQAQDNSRIHQVRQNVIEQTEGVAHRAQLIVWTKIDSVTLAEFLCSHHLLVDKLYRWDFRVEIAALMIFFFEKNFLREPLPLRRPIVPTLPPAPFAVRHPDHRGQVRFGLSRTSGSSASSHRRLWKPFHATLAHFVSASAIVA